MNLARYYHTLRHLRPVQFYGRVAHRLPRTTPLSNVAPPARASQTRFPLAPQRTPSMLSPERFLFLNAARDLSAAADWNDPDTEKLWLYNLHYFDDLCALGRDERCDWHEALMRRWIDENPPGLGNGWEPYPVSLRIVNWVKWALAGHALAGSASSSLAQQARHLERRLEHHLLGNHLWKNGKALVFVGAYFEGAEAAAWLHKGFEIIDAQLQEQLLDDGGHFELSPMYHAIFVEDLLDLLALDRCWPGLAGRARVERWRSAVVRMLAWLRAMSHPDGEIAFFNDAASGIAPRPAVLDDWATRLGLDALPSPVAGLIVLEDSGYARLQAGDFLIIADVGRIGPDYLPGHAHADTLAFEFCWRGQRVLTNSGTSRYGTSHQRLIERGTAAHNTVTIDNEDSSEVWSGFRVARRARPQGRQASQDGERLTLECAHDGYARLKGRPLHRRRWELDALGLAIADSITGSGDHRVTGRMHVHPGIKVERRNEREFVLDVPDAGRLMLELQDSVQGRVFAGMHAWEFGRVVSRPVIEWIREGALPFATTVSIKPC